MMIQTCARADVHPSEVLTGRKLSDSPKRLIKRSHSSRITGQGPQLREKIEMNPPSRSVEWETLKQWSLRNVEPPLLD